MIDAAAEVAREASRRRTFAIISHPDAGKTTLTEKFLLYAGALQEAGAVKARAGRRRVTSDWMSMEQERGISITATALQFGHGEAVLNLLDTPGHRDFSEDTYRVLAAADAAVMVLDAAKGIEAQTLKLFEVCRERGVPLVTFINKFDRPGLAPLELLDDIERQIEITPTPVTWPVGPGGDFRGVVDRRSGDFVRYGRSARGATEADEEIVAADVAATEEGEVWEQAAEELELLEVMEAEYRPETFLAGETSPVFFGSALTNFGVRQLLDAMVDIAPPPSSRPDADGSLVPLEGDVAGVVFKVQANMDRAHRDRVAFVRLCAGRFERGMNLRIARTGSNLGTKHAQSLFGADRTTVDLAYPGDIIGLVNATELHVGDTVHAGKPFEFPPIPRFAPELFRVARSLDASRTKQFRKGLEQLEVEGVVQVLRDPTGFDTIPLLGAIGQLQFDVALSRLEDEFGAKVELAPSPYQASRLTDAESAPELDALPGVRVASRADGTLLALFESSHWLDRLEFDRPELTLERVVL
ncbi:MAG: peptide chain release factor 3 [Actinomycetota bacterium]